MLKLRTVLLALVLSLGGVTSGALAAFYNSGNIGVAGEWYFQEWTTYLHDGTHSPMHGITGRADSSGRAAWMQGRADGGHKTGKHGYQTDSSANFHVFCTNYDEFISGLEGWYTSSAGVYGLRIRCRGPNEPEYGLLAMLGKRNGTYKSIKCSNQDVSWGFFGGEGPYLMRVGLICDRYPGL